jgi:predicted metal-dependent peptidase
MSGNVSRSVDELLHPKVDWREALREFVKTHTRGGDQSTWRRPHRKYLACNVIMPSSESHKAKTFVVGIDTSGSIGGDELSQFLGELKCIVDEVTPECIELLYWDSSVAKHETYRDAEVSNLVETTKPSGGGGTSPACVPEYMSKHSIEPQCVIMLTDGYFGSGGCGDWSKCVAPVLWCVMGNRTFVPTVGQSVFVE